jgi:hypothetical protein
MRYVIFARKEPTYVFPAVAGDTCTSLSYMWAVSYTGKYGTAYRGVPQFLRSVDSHITMDRLPVRTAAFQSPLPYIFRSFWNMSRYYTVHWHKMPRTHCSQKPEFGSIMGADDGWITYSFSSKSGGEIRVASIDLCPVQRIVSIAHSERNRFSIGVSFARELMDGAIRGLWW